MNNLMDLGGGVGWIGTLFIGAIAGWIAEKLTRSDMGLIMNIIVGVIGSYIGGFLANAAGMRLNEIVSGWFWGNLLISVVGAVVLIVIVKTVRGRSA